MTDEPRIHLVKASFQTQFRTAMEACGASADAYFDKVKLPRTVTDPESLLPVRSFFRLANMFAIEEDVPNFGSIVAQTTPWHRVSSLAPMIRDADCLETLLNQFCKVANGQSSVVNFELQQTETEARFTYHNTLDYPDDVQMELYRMTSMVQLVQLATGSTWRPRSIDLLMPPSRVLESCPLLCSSQTRFAQPIASISIENARLPLPVQIDIPESVPSSPGNPADQHREFGDSIRQIIDGYTLSGGLKIEDLAYITDQSVRNLQRRLKLAGLNFNRLVGESRHQHACEKLCNTGLPIAEIAAQLGYSDPAHFSRAFRRWSGLSPAQFRKQHRPTA